MGGHMIANKILEHELLMYSSNGSAASFDEGLSMENKPSSRLS